MIYFVNINLKLKLPITVRSYFDSSKVRRERNSIILIYIVPCILLGPEDARIGFTFFTTTRDFSEIQRSILLVMINCEILLFILTFGN